jgi:hypothetical protein
MLVLGGVPGPAAAVSGVSGATFPGGLATTLFIDITFSRTHYPHINHLYTVESVSHWMEVTLRGKNDSNVTCSAKYLRGGAPKTRGTYPRCPFTATNS